jgi:hypothetical protein
MWWTSPGGKEGINRPERYREDIPTTPHVGRNAKERSADKKTNILRELEPGAFEAELLRDRSQNETGDNLQS